VILLAMLSINDEKRLLSVCIDQFY